MTTGTTGNEVCNSFMALKLASGPPSKLSRYAG